MHSKLCRLLIFICALIAAPGLHSALASDLSIPINPMFEHSDEMGSGLANVQASLLPRICPSVTPVGGAVPACCLYGSVWLDGEPITGAEVTIEAASGLHKSEITAFQSESDTRPEYGMALSGKPMYIHENQVVTITARDADRFVTITYTVKLGTQRVDLALPSSNVEENYALLRNKILWKQSDEGRVAGPRGMAIDSQGDIYVIDRENQRIQVFDPNGQPRNSRAGLSTWGKIGNGDGEFFTPFGIAIDSNDNIYVIDTGNHRIQKFNSRGGFIDKWGSFGNALGQFYSPEGIAIDSEGFIYVSDSANHRIQKFRPNGELDELFGLSGTIGNRDTGKIQFSYPTAIAIDSKNNFYVTDYQNHRVQKFDNTGELLEIFGTYGVCGGQSGCQNGDLNLPDGIAIDSEDNVYISDINHRVQKFDADGTWLAEFGKRGTDDGEFTYPKNLAVDNDGNIYVADEANDRLQKFNSEFEWLETWGTQGKNSQQLVFPQGMATDSQDNLYIADKEAHRIQQFNRNGEWVRNIGTYGSAQGEFDQPVDIYIDREDNLYIVDSGNHRIQKLNNAEEVLDTWGSLGSGNDEFKSPVALAFDADEQHFYVVDKFNHRVQKFNSDGTYLATLSEKLIGSNEIGEFNAPRDVAVGPEGNVYVADTLNHRVQKFTSDGEYLDKIGGDESTRFYYVTGIDVDDSGNLYAIDRRSHIQKFDATGQHLVTWGAAPIRVNDSGDNAPTFNQLTCNREDCVLRLALGPNGDVYVADPENNRVQPFRQQSTGKPIVVINWAGKTSLEYNDWLRVSALGQDSDLTNKIEAYEWRSDKNGLLSNDNELKTLASDLISGTHTISVRAKDDEGVWSEPNSMTIYIPPKPEEEITWTLLFYLAGDYPDSEQLLQSFNETIDELKAEFSNSTVRVAIQLDGPSSNDTRRLTLVPGNPAILVETPMDELDMDDHRVLADFIRWGQGEFRADNYYLAIANHGQATQGIAWDRTSAERRDENLQAYRLTVKELRQALSANDVDRIAVLHLDACSMNLLETAYEIKDYTDVLISSQWMGWDYFPYHKYVNAIGKNSNPKGVAEEIIEIYSQEVKNDGYPYTISALNMLRSDIALNAIDALAAELSSYLETYPAERSIMEGIRNETQTFESDGDFKNTPIDMYVDLVTWAERVIDKISNPSIQEKAQNMIDELENQFILFNEADSNSLPSYIPTPESVTTQPNPRWNKIVEEKHIKDDFQIDNSGATGLSIFYPVNQRSEVFRDYVGNSLFSFTTASTYPNWTRFLRAATEPCDDPCNYEDPPPPISQLPTYGLAGPPSEPTIPTPTNSPSPTSSPTPTSTPAATSTPTPLPIETSTATDTVTPTNTWTATPTEMSTFTVTPTATSTSTDIPEATVTETSTSTGTATHTPTSTNTEIPIDTETPTATITLTDTETPTSTGTETSTATSTSTGTPTSTDTATHIPTSTSTETPTPSATVTSTETLTPAATSTVSPTSNPDGTSVDPEDATPASTETPTPVDTPIPDCNKVRTGGVTCNGSLLYLPIIER